MSRLHRHVERHTVERIGWLRAAVLDANDGIVSTGFGVLTRIDVRETMKAKLDKDFRPYVILGACNPTLAYEALQLEDKVGTMLPCNVVIQQPSPGKIEVAAVDPVAPMQAIDNPRLKEAAMAVREKLSRVIASL